MEQEKFDVTQQGLGTFVGKLIATEVIKKLLSLLIAMGKEAMIEGMEILKEALGGTDDETENPTHTD